MSAGTDKYIDFSACKVGRAGKHLGVRVGPGCREELWTKGGEEDGISNFRD